MSLISRTLAPPASHELAEVVTALLSARVTAEPRLPLAPQPSGTPQLPSMPTGLGTSAARIPRPILPPRPDVVRRSRPGLPTGPTGLGTSAARTFTPEAPPPRQPPSVEPASRLHCPPALRDDPALGETVNERLVEWAAEVGIYPGQLDKVRRAGFGRVSATPMSGGIVALHSGWRL